MELSKAWAAVPCRFLPGVPRDRKGYSYTRRAGEYRGAHVWAWMDANGNELPPKGMCVCHRCDVPLCIEAAHLFLGTPADNTHDAQAKGRIPTRAPRRQMRHPRRQTYVRSIAMLRSPTDSPLDHSENEDGAVRRDPAVPDDVSPPADPHQPRARSVHWPDELHAYVTAVAREGERQGYTRAEFNISTVAREALHRVRDRLADPADAANAIIRSWRKGDDGSAPPPSKARSVWWDDEQHGWLEDVVREGKRAGSKAFNISVVVREALYRFRTRYPEPAAAATAIIRGWEREAKREG
jgi:hypothetical protein